MTSYERIRAMVDNKPVDRPALAAWYHMPLRDGVPKDFAQGIIQSVQNNHFDLAKLQYHAYHFSEAFGCEFVRSTNPRLLMGPITKMPIYNAAQFRKLKPVTDVTKGALGRELETTKRVIDKLGGKVPVLATIYSPLSNAKELFGSLGHNEWILSAIEYQPDDVKVGIEVMLETTKIWLDELIKAGIDGIFYADQFASKSEMPVEIHREFSTPYDLEVLNYIKDRTWFNMLHVHGWKNLCFDEYEKYEYPVQAYNWEDRLGDENTGTTLKKARSMTDKILMAGIEHWNDLVSPTNDRWAVKQTLMERFKDALEQLGPNENRFIFTPGCSYKMHIDEYLIELMYEVVSEVTGVE